MIFVQSRKMMRTAATLANRLKRRFFSSFGDIKLSSLPHRFLRSVHMAVPPEMTDRIPGSSPLASLVSNTPSPAPPPASCELLHRDLFSALTHRSLLPQDSSRNSAASGSHENTASVPYCTPSPSYSQFPSVKTAGSNAS